MTRRLARALVALAACLYGAGPARAEAGASVVRGGGDSPAPRDGYGAPGRARWRPEPVPELPDDATDLATENAMRDAPAPPAASVTYGGPQQAMKAAQYLRKTVPTFVNFRSTIVGATWRSSPAHEWRVRPAPRCLATLRARGLRVRAWRPEDGEGAAAEPSGGEPLDEESLDIVPAPVHVSSPVRGVHFRSGHGSSLLVACEMAARLPLLADIVAREGVDHVVVVSAWRPRPRTSFHTMGLALDITRFHVTAPLPGPRGDTSPWLEVLTDFLATPGRDTCDPTLLEPDSPLGGNERGRRLLRIACAMHRSGLFSSVLTPNYNPGHRDHFHIDIRPDDPRVFLR
jgi:hypothetical protein